MIAIVYLVKATVIVLTAAVAVALARRRASSSTRHFICALAIGGLLALPLVSWVVPEWTPFSLSWLTQSAQPVLDTETGPTMVGGLTAGVAPGAQPNAATTRLILPELVSNPARDVPWQVVLLVVYLSGACVLFGRLAVEHATVRRLLRRTTTLDAPEWRALLEDCARRIGVRGVVRLLSTPECMPPVAIGIRHRAIVLPAFADEWAPEVRRAVLMHELAHVSRRDCLTQTGAALACALYWVHPGAWWLARRLRIDRELACDDIVLSTGISPAEYGRNLLEVAYRLGGTVPPALAVGMSRRGGLETRLFALLDESRNRAALTSRARAAAVALGALLTLAIAAPTARAVQSNDTVLAQPGAGADRHLHPEWARRFLSVDYWRRTAVWQLARMADHLRYLNEMRDLGYSAADVPTLFTLRRHGVTPDYVRALGAEGLSNLSTAELLAAVRQGVTPGYVRDMKSTVDPAADVELLVRLRRYGIDGDFVRELDDVGFQRLSIEMLLQARRHGISADYIHGFQVLGYDWSMDELVRARSHGVEREYVEAVAARGHPQISLDDLIRLRRHGVSLTHIETANERAGTVVPVNELVRLASHGWRE
jgi:beta-lactamase regulating signal transducer with metallopeptidase domain